MDSLNWVAITLATAWASLVLAIVGVYAAYQLRAS